MLVQNYGRLGGLGPPGSTTPVQASKVILNKVEKVMHLLNLALAVLVGLPIE